MRKMVAVLACRNNGSRLYGKPMQNLDITTGVTILDNIIACLRSFDVIEDIVLGISEGSENHDFIDYAKINDLDFIIGDENDVLSRLVQCGVRTGATDIFRVTSESPFVYYNLIEDAWKWHVVNQNDATLLDGIIDGCGFEILIIASVSVLLISSAVFSRAIFPSATFFGIPEWTISISRTMP